MKHWILSWAIVVGLLVGASPSQAVDDYRPLATLQNAAAATGNGTALDVAGYGTVAVQVTISATATVTFEGSSDGATWASVVCSSTDSTSATLTTSATATGLYQCSVSGLSNFRARISSFGSGTVTVTGRAVRMSLGKRGGSTGGGGSASAAGSTGAVQSNNGGLLADSGCTSTASSGKITCANGFVASSATFTDLSVTNRTGTGAPVFGSSPTLTTPNLGTPSSINLVNGTAMPATGLTGTVGVSNGGTGSTSFTGGRCVQVNAGGTAFISASGACGTAASGASSSGASGVVQGADGSGGLVSTGCSAVGGQLTCPGGFVAGTSALGVISMLQGTATVAGATTGQHNIWIDSTDGVLHSYGYGAASAATYMTTTTPATMQNKTMILSAGNGNIFKAMRTLFFPLAGCNGAVCGPVWDLPASGAATVAQVAGTNTFKGVMQFSDNADQSAQLTWHLPPMWTGSVPATIAWYTTATTGNMTWILQTACTAQGSTDDPAFNATGAGNTVTKAAQGTTLQVSFATMPAVTMTGCSANNIVHFNLRRVASQPTDTLLATASAISVQLGLEETYR